jgi:hypothetical protein
MSPKAVTLCWAAGLLIAVLFVVGWFRYSAKDRAANALRRARKKALETFIATWLGEISKSNFQGGEIFEKLFKTRVDEFNKLLIGTDRDFWPGQVEFDSLTRRVSDLKTSDFNGPKPAKEMLSERLQALVVFLNQN